MSAYVPEDFTAGEETSHIEAIGERVVENPSQFRSQQVDLETNPNIIENGIYFTYEGTTKAVRVEILTCTSAYGRNEGYGNDRWPILEHAKSNQDAISLKVIAGADGGAEFTIFVGDGAGGYGDNSRILAQCLAQELMQLTASQLDEVTLTDENEVDLAIRRAKLLAKEQYESGAAAAAMAIAGVTITPDGLANVTLVNLGDVVGYKIPATIRDGQTCLLTEVHRQTDIDGLQIPNMLSKCVVIPASATVEKLQAEKRFSDFYKAETTLEHGEALFMATDGFWELMKLLASRENKSLQAYMAGLLVECPTNSALAARIDSILKTNFLEMQAYNLGRSQGKRLPEPEWHPDNIGFMIFRLRAL